MNHEDPYAQHKAEMIAARLHADPTMSVSRPVLWVGGVHHIAKTIMDLKVSSKFPQVSYQIKYNGDRDVLRLSDYHTRHVCEPGEYFWMLDDIILGGTMVEHGQLNRVVGFVRGTVDEPGEFALTAFHFAIVKALKALRSEKK